MGLIGAGQQAPPPYPGQGQVGQPSLQQPSTPMFVTPPAKSQRLLHSEAYLRYIEGLNAESSTVSKWDQALSGSFYLCMDSDLVLPSYSSFIWTVIVLWLYLHVNCFLRGQCKCIKMILFHQLILFFVLSVQKQDVRLTKEQESRLPSHWLKSKGAHKTMADALWRLRDLMLRDTLNIRQMHNL